MKQKTTDLTVDGVTISAQDVGTRILVFLQASSMDAIKERFYSFWNHGATGGELEWWSDTCAAFWVWGSKTETPLRRLESAMVMATEAKHLNQGEDKGFGRCLTEVRRMLAQMKWVHWYQNLDVFTPYSMGDSIVAERGTGNFNDDVLGVTIEKSQTHTLETA